MPQTSDRFPGERLEEELVLDDRGPGGDNDGDPSTEGALRRVTNALRFFFGGVVRQVLQIKNPPAGFDDADLAGIMNGQGLAYNTATQQLEPATFSGTDELVKVTANDTTPDYLLSKLAAGANISITETNDGGDEDATIAVTGITTGPITYRQTIWAEENAILNNGADEWSYGNGAVGAGIGVPVFDDGEIVGMVYNAMTAGDATTEVQVMVNGASVSRSIIPGNGVQNATTSFTAVAVTAGDLIGFQTVLAGGAADVRVGAVIEYSIPITGLKGDQGDPGPAGLDENVKVSANDTTAGFLTAKLVAGTNVTLTELNDGLNETYEISASGGTDVKDLQVTANDTTPEFLDDKLVVTGAGISKSVLNPAADESLQLAIATAAASTLNPDAGNLEGVANSLARSDHIHDVPADTAVDIGAGGTSIEGVSTSFARADHVHRIVDPSDEVQATGNISTTSTVPITASGMTITPGEGTYLVWFSSWGQHNNNNSEITIGVAVDGVDVAASERQFGNKANSDDVRTTLATQAKVVATAGQAIQGRFWKTSGPGAVELNDRILTILKVDD